jgi:hypothetical protein
VSTKLGECQVAIDERSQFLLPVESAWILAANTVQGEKIGNLNIKVVL